MWISRKEYDKLKERENQLMKMYNAGIREGRKEMLEKVNEQTRQALNYEFGTGQKHRAFIQLVNGIRTLEQNN